MEVRNNAPTSVLITGASGYVGRATAAAASAHGYRVTGTYQSHPPRAGRWPGMQIVKASIDEIPGIIDALRPEAVLHAAAAWRTDAEAQEVIVAGTRAIARAARQNSARLIHMSTDMVFDGEHAPYSEGDPPAPVNFYGAAKAEAERIVAEICPDAAIVRTSLVTCFDPPDPRTLLILDALHGRRPPATLFADEYRCPVRTEDLAAALVELVSLPFSGILHVAGPERLSRYELGLRIAAFHGLDPAAGIVPCLTSESGMKRPRDCSLSIELARRTLHTELQNLLQP